MPTLSTHRPFCRIRALVQHIAFAVRLLWHLHWDMRAARRQLSALPPFKNGSVGRKNSSIGIGGMAWLCASRDLLRIAVRPLEEQQLMRERQELLRIYQLLETLPQRAWEATTPAGQRVLRSAVAKLMESICGQATNQRVQEQLPCDRPIRDTLLGWLQQAGAVQGMATRWLLIDCVPLLNHVPAGLAIDDTTSQNVWKKLRHELDARFIQEATQLRRIDLYAHYRLLSLRCTAIPAALAHARLGARTVGCSSFTSPSE